MNDSTQTSYREAYEAFEFCSKCHACKQVIRENAWRALLKGFTFGAIDLTLPMDKVWKRHQEIFTK